MTRRLGLKKKGYDNTSVTCIHGGGTKNNTSKDDPANLPTVETDKELLHSNISPEEMYDAIQKNIFSLTWQVKMLENRIHSTMCRYSTAEIVDGLTVQTKIKLEGKQKTEKQNQVNSLEDKRKAVRKHKRRNQEASCSDATIATENAHSNENSSVTEHCSEVNIHDVDSSERQSENIYADANNNHPINADETGVIVKPQLPVLSDKPSASTPIVLEGVFKFGVEKEKSSSRSSSISSERTPVSSRKRKKYVLFPIGAAANTGSPTKTITKWTDVASIINQGVAEHRNLNPYKTARDVKMTTLESGRILTETHSKFVGVNLMMALRFLHENEILHGSLSPKKVVFNDKGYPYLTGFQSADIIEERQSRPRERYPVEYSSPEQLWQSFVGEETDIWSTGAMLYAIIYGRAPHQGQDYAETRRQILDNQFVPKFAPEVISESGKKFISKCIRKKDSRRFSIVDLKKKGLFESVQWFSSLNEDRLYRQILPSPMLNAIKKLEK